MRRRVKFQGILSEDAEETSSIGLNSLLESSMASSRPSRSSKSTPSSVFSSGSHEFEEEESNGWTVSSLNQSKRLYGRSREKSQLRQAYRRLWESEPGSKPTVQLALISGGAGSGKTALATSLRQLVTEDGGFFITGKFDQLQSSQIYCAFVSAFTELVEAVIKRGKDAMKSLQRAILSAVHSEQKVLVDMIPALEKILGPPKKDSVKEFRQSSDEVSCFKFVFRMFVRAISSPEFPIVFLLDDIHFADDASLDLLRSLISDSTNDGILFIGTYRVDKTTDGSISHLLSDQTSRVTDIKLYNLSAKAVDEMVAEIFSVIHSEQIRSLTDIIYRQTLGNVFYIREFLRFLQEKNLLIFDEKEMEWIWDERKIHMSIDFRRPIELITVRISSLPKATREVLEVAACLGSKIDEQLLNSISPRPVFSQLQRASQRGFLTYDESTEEYYFAHDIIQEAAYKMISPQEREAFHLTIGRELWKGFGNIEDLENNIFTILGQIRQGADLITYQEERNDVAALCLRAGELAICSSSFQTASEYLLLGVTMLGEQCWDEEYELSLELYNAAAEVEYSIANFDNVERLASEIFANTRWFPDTLRAHSIHVYSLGSRGHMLKAIERGLEVLEALGEKFPSNPTSHNIAVAIKKTKNLVKGRSNDSLLRMPLMDKPEKVAAMHMMNIIFLYAYIAVPSLAPLIATRMVKLSIEYGICDLSSIGFVTFAMLLCGTGNDMEEGYRCGELALDIYEKFASKTWMGRVSAWFYGAVCHWKRPIRVIFEPLKNAHRLALETGDIDFAMLNANIYCWESFDISTLSKLEKIISGFSQRMEVYGHESTLMMFKPLWQLVHNLTGRGNKDPQLLTGEIMEQEYTIQYARENNKTLLIWTHFYRMLLAYLFGDFEAADTHANVCRCAESNPFGSSDRVLLVFYEGLVALAQAKKSRSRLKQAHKAIKTFKGWAKQSPENFLGKQFFLEAELAAATGDHKRAHSKFTSAISLSREGGYVLQHALANERAGRYFLGRGDEETGLSYMNEALVVYSKWAGVASPKVIHLEASLSGLR